MNSTPFDPTAALPAGRVLLEASAGTGKTWTIAALVTRYVAEADIPIDRLLVVTFTRAATSELRERCRDRLVEAARFLASEGGPEDTSDPVLGHLAACDPDERAARTRRLNEALRGFDRATITTLHGLAHRFLVEMGLLSRTPLPREVVTDQSEVVDEVVNDLYIRMFADGVDTTLQLRAASEIAAGVAATPDARIVPDPAAAEGVAKMRAEFAHEFRATLDRRIRGERITSFDGLLLLARDALVHTDTGRRAAARLAARYRVGLIDEFQDTDGIQWQTVEAVFGSEDSTMVMIGDPKQSIYAFRGADIGAYLSAAAAAGTTFTLTTNWRSDAPLVQALDSVFDSLAFGDERIVYRPVTAAAGREDASIRYVHAPLCLRLVGRDSPVKQNQDNTLSVPAARAYIARDVAEYVHGLLTRPAEIRGDESWRPVRPGDIAILCRTRLEVDQVRATLGASSIPSVVGRTGDVFRSDAATAWLSLLAAFEFPSSVRRVRAAALTPFIGWTPARLAQVSDEELMPLNDLVAAWAELLRDGGVAAVWKDIERTTEVTRRVLAGSGGERLATDLDHVLEMLHAAHRAGARSLHDWLLAEIQRAEARDEEDETRARRLETDSDAVQVLTAHAAKGLEFPIVLCPFLWNVGSGPVKVPVFHPEGGDTRLIDVSGGGPDFDEAVAQVTRGSDAEEMRLAYVALTRARHHLVVWWAAVKKSATAPLTRMLFGRLPDGGGMAEQVDLTRNDRPLWQALQARTAASDGTLHALLLDHDPAATHYEPERPSPQPIATARFGRSVDMTWRRTSFSGLTADVEHVVTRDNPETTAKTDEPPPPSDEEGEVLVPAVLPMAALPGGFAFGNLVHGIFEEVDLTGADRAERLAAASRIHVASSGSTADPEQLAPALVGVSETPLFAEADSVRLADIARSDQLAEMVFEIPISTDGPAVPVERIANLIEDHLPTDHPLRSYGARLRDISGTRFRGYLSGAIDAVVRIGEPQRFWIVDYKTNRLGTDTIADYNPTALARAMVDGDYVLQSLLYQVALHRYLGARLPGYDPATHLGGSLYLFVRGMVGAATQIDSGHRFGVQRWDVSVDLIEAVSGLFEVGGS